MQVDLEERLIDHPGELGTARKEIIRRFLRDYLPKRFEVATGFVFDSAGQVSNQMDVIIADSSVCPRFETAGSKFYFPCESVVAVGAGQVIDNLRRGTQGLLGQHRVREATGSLGWWNCERQKTW
jgi:hypothetical protein